MQSAQRLDWTEAPGGAYTQEQLRARVKARETGVVVLREVPVGKPDSWRLLLQLAREANKRARPWTLIIDLSDVAARPDAAYREAIITSMKVLDTAHIAFVQPGSMLVRATMWVILRTLPLRTSVHKDMNGALSAVRKALLHG